MTLEDCGHFAYVECPAVRTALQDFARQPVVAGLGVDLITFEKGQRKDDVAQKYLATFAGDEGVLFIGKTQEKASVNHYYVYLPDRELGSLFIKFCSDFPYPAKLSFNRHEWLKRQLRGVDRLPHGRTAYAARAAL